MLNEDLTGELDPAAEDQLTGEQGQVAAGQQEGETTGAASQSEGQLAALQAERRKRQEAEAAVAGLQAQVNLIQQQLAGQQVQMMPQQAQDYFARQGLEDDDTPTVAQLRAFANEVRQESDAKAAQVSTRSATDAFINSKADYAQVVGTKDWQGNFIPSPLFIETMNNDPALAAEVAAGRVTAPVAYAAAKGFKAQKDLAAVQSQQQQHQNAQQVHLRTAPLPASAAGGIGATSPGAEFAGLDMSKPEDRAKMRAVAAQAEAGDFG